MLSPKEGWRRMNWKLYAKVKRHKKRISSWEEGLSSLPEGEWAVAECQRGMTQDEVKNVCRGATPWKTGIFLRGRVELFTKGWMSCCWAQWEITQDKVKLVCRYAMPWKMGNFMRGRAELFTGGWVSWCWVPKRVDAENEKNNYKKNEGNRKGKYKHFV